MTFISCFRSRNWMRYRGEFELALEPGCYAILAEGESNKGRSNYYGKSSFLSALKWSLEGGKVAGYDTIDDLISYGEDEFGVDVELSDGAFISREKQRGRPASLLVQVGDKKLQGDEAQEMIERVIGLSKEDRLSTCWSEQDDLATPIKSTPTTLTRMIEKWLGSELEKLVEAGELATEDLKMTSDFHAKAVGGLSELERIGSDAEVSRLEASAKDLKYGFETATKLMLAVQKTREAYASRRSHRDLIQQAKDLRVEISRNQNVVHVKDTAVEQAALDAASTKVNRLRTEVEALEVQRDKLQKLVRGEFDGACPVSKGFRCPSIVEINSLHEPNRTELEKVEKLLRGKAQELSGAIGARSVKQAAYADAQAALTAAARAAERISNLKVQEAKVFAGRQEYEKQGVEPLEPGEAILPALPAPSDFALKKAEADLANAKRARDSLQEARRRVEETATEVRAHRLRLGVIGPEGARRRVLESTVAKIQNKANQLFSDAGIDLQVKAVWGREVGSLADQCSECGRAFPASAKVKRCECGALRGQKFKNEFKWKLNHVSGAAWNMGGLVIRCAGFDFLKTKRGTPWSVAVMDEISGSLDDYHRRSISASIRRLLVGTFEQAFITAHDKSSLEACDKKILVSGGEQWSKIKVVGA